MAKATFKVTILYKSGQSATVDGLVEFTYDNGGVQWKEGSRSKILKINYDAIEAVFYDINPWYKNLYFAIWRKLNG